MPSRKNYALEAVGKYALVKLSMNAPTPSTYRLEEDPISSSQYEMRTQKLLPEYYT
jgi:hypothetical protein